MKLKSSYAKQRVAELTKQHGTRQRQKVKLIPPGRKPLIKIGRG